MGAIRFGESTVLVTVDQVADGVHVQVANTPLDRIAHKAIVRNLSDVAAMAALPIGAVAAASLPRDFGKDRANVLFDHMHRIAAEHDCPLIGGDISFWDHPLVLTVTILADPAGIEPVLRSGGQAGDRVYVTGRLGAAWREDGGGPHLTAEPRIAVARALASQTAVKLHGMIDLSDGLAGDLRHICERSGVDARIEAASIPCRDGADVNRALYDGEDYELCFTAAGEVPAAVEGVMITPIGWLIERQAGDEPMIALTHADGRNEILTRGGWEHTNEP
jgi:thiamine-monophosphate kinase